MLWKNVLADLEQAKGLAEEARKLCFSPGGPYLYDDAISSDLLLIRDAQEKALTGDFDGTRAGPWQSGFCKIVYEETEGTCG